MEQMDLHIISIDKIDLFPAILPGKGLEQRRRRTLQSKVWSAVSAELRKARFFAKQKMPPKKTSGELFIVFYSILLHSDCGALDRTLKIWKMVYMKLNALVKVVAVLVVVVNK